MRPVKFKECNTVFGEKQEEYENLPAYLHASSTGEVVTCWELDGVELQKVKSTGQIWLTQMTFGHPFQPVHLGVECPIQTIP